MSPILRPESAARSRDQLLGAIALTLRAGALPGGVQDAERRDMLAFVALALGRLAESAEATAEAWERRGYWVKADRFREQWTWAGRSSRELKVALARHDLGSAGAIAGGLVEHLVRVTIPTRLSRSKPWKDAWDELAKEGIAP